MAGRFITLEGGEGSGKSTQVKRLAAALEAKGIAALTTREPGGSPGAEEIRALLVNGEPGRWDALTETLLIYAARADHVARTIGPALLAGKWVISRPLHRFHLCLSGRGRGVARETIRRIDCGGAGRFQARLHSGPGHRCRHRPEARRGARRRGNPLREIRPRFP